MALLTERYAKKIRGQLSCYDRIIIQGTLPGFCYADGMTAFLYANNIRIFDYPRFAQSLVENSTSVDSKTEIFGTSLQTNQVVKSLGYSNAFEPMA